eukprot:gene13214-17713_t
MAKLNQQDITFPWLAMSAICLGMLGHSVVFTSPLPYVAFMILDFKMTDDIDLAGYWAGWITGSFMLGRTIAGIPWGMAADKFGRKICLMISMINVTIFSIIFGCSTNFAMACAIRLLIGLGNGFMGIAKTAITEIVSTKEHEVRAFGYLNGIWGLGMIVGPVIGGFFSRPAIQYPSYFSPSSLWGRKPYLLPCLICSSIAVIAFISILLFVPETLKRNANNIDNSNNSSSDAMISQQTNKNKNSKFNFLKKSNKQSYDLLQTESSQFDDEGLVSNQSVLCHTIICGWNLKCWKNNINNNNSNDENENNYDNDDNKDNITNKDDFFDVELNEDDLKKQNLKKIVELNKLNNKNNSDNNSNNESFPLWCVTSIEKGGLSWDSAQVGVVLSSVGLGLVLFQMFLYEKIINRYFQCKPSQTFYILISIAGIALIFLPVMMYLALLINPIHTMNQSKNNLVMYISLIGVLLLYRACTTSAFSTLAIVVNASVAREMR